VLYAGLVQWPARLPTGAGMLGCVLMLATLPWPTLPLADYQLLCLGLVCLPLAWLLPNLRNNSNERVETAA